MLPIQLPTFATNSKLKPMNIKDKIQRKCEDMNEGNIQESFRNIAEELFQNYCIQCGQSFFYFAEIEFYYFDEARFHSDWNEVTYERDGYRAGDLFYHLSGVDICFDSHLLKVNGKKSGYGGGILIRSIVEVVDGKEELTFGPLTCMNKMLNSCKGGNMPKLASAPQQRNRTLKATYRYLGQKDFDSISEGSNKDGIFQLAFYDNTEELWKQARSSYYKRLIRNHQ